MPSSIHDSIAKVTDRLACHRQRSGFLGFNTALFAGLILSIVVLRVSLWLVYILTPPACLESADHEIYMTVLNHEQNSPRVMRLDAQIDSVLSDDCQQIANSRVRLNWYMQKPHALPTLTVQTKVHATLRLRRPWGMKNPGGFDYGLWLIGRGFSATGYVRQGRVLDRSSRKTPSFSASQFVHGALLEAMLLGRREAVTDEQWQLFRDTGTVHLMVVSGLHVGVFAGLVYILAFNLLRNMPVVSLVWVPRRQALSISIAAMIAVMWATGGEAPVIRAGLMAILVALSFITLRRISLWRCLWLVAAFTLLWQPRFVLLQGFWLSFAAVAGLLVGFAPRLPNATPVRSFVACQVVLLVWLTPWLSVTVGVVPWVRSLANMLVVPVVTLLTIPCGMLGLILLVLPGLEIPGLALLQVADFSMALVLQVLAAMQTLSWQGGYFNRSIALLAFVSSIVLLLPCRPGLRLLALFGWLPVLLPGYHRVAVGEFRLTVFDVGQGSALVVDTRSRRLLVDVGAAFPSGFNMADAVVVPGLLSSGPNRVDRVVISHLDNDHAGGLSHIKSLFPNAQVIGDEQDCVSGKIWQWDQVEFELLADGLARSRNDGSCTVIVRNSAHQVYLSGDIGKRAELRLLPRLPKGVAVLLAPHHGSTTSSSYKFVHQLCPRFVVYSAARNNRYGHPDPTVMQRYADVGAQQVLTAEVGAVSWYSRFPDRLRTWRKGLLVADVNPASGEREYCRRQQSFGAARQ